MCGNEKFENESLHAGHRKRLRESVSENGFSQLEDHVLLELLLFYSVPRGDTNNTAHLLLRNFGSLSGVLNAKPEELKAVPGIGENSAVLIGTLSEIYSRIFKENCGVRDKFTKSEDVDRVAKTLFFKENSEVVYIVCFDEAMRHRGTFRVIEGDFNRVDINFRAILETAALAKAKSVVIIHNHPHSSHLPSLSDVDATRDIAVALRRCGIKVKDHMIVGADGEVYSFANSKEYKNMLG